jgi:hypothetical protein
VVAVTRVGHARIVTPSFILQEGDQVHLAVDDDGLDELRPMIMDARRVRQDDGPPVAPAGPPADRPEAGGARPEDARSGSREAR